MEVDKIQTQACKFSRVANGRIGSNKIGLKGTGGGSGGTQDYPDEEEDGEVRQSGPSITIGGARGRANGVGELGVEGNRLRVWQPPSRILRVSRASGGKDRHSKVLTAKGPRDRRVRLSVHTAIQFYDLQDRLGFDQPSKAVEWLIKAASDHIAELPSLDTTYLPHTSRQANQREPNLGAAGALQQELNSSAHLEINSDPNLNQTQQQNQHGSFSKSACSSNTSDTSKGSGLSLSRSEIRVKARERARERAKEKEKENESINVHHNNNAVNSLPQSSSFTQLLTAGINNAMNQNGGAGAEAEPRLFHKPTRANNQWLSGSAPMDYFSGTGLLGSSSSSRPNHTSGSGFSLQTQMGNSMAEPVTVSPFSVVGGEHHNPELQQFSFSSDHLVQVANTAAAAAATAAGNDYNLNFTVSSSPAFAGFNRGTLQSNSPSLFPYLQRLSPTDGSGVPFFLGTAAVSSIVPPPMENSTLHHHHQQFVPSGLQLCYGTGGRQSDHKGKGKN